MKARWFKGYETEVGKALAGGSSTYRPEVNYMKKHKVTLHTLLQNTILSHFRPYNYSVPYHTIPRCSLWWWMLIVRWPDAPPAPGPNQVITQWPGLITMRLITPHTIITDHLAISYNTTACWCTYKIQHSATYHTRPWHKSMPLHLIIAHTCITCTKWTITHNTSWHLLISSWHFWDPTFIVPRSGQLVMVVL